MRAGTIGHVISYFFQNPASAGEVDRALREFFEIKSTDELPAVAPDFGNGGSPSHRYFHEWFIYDFKLSGRRTPLRTWYEDNPTGMVSADMQVYADLLRENEYGFFKVISSVPGRVEVESFANGKRYTVREYSAAPFLKPNEAITARVGLVEGRYEFVGGLVGSIDAEFGDNAQKLFGRSRKAITPKEIYQTWYAPDRSSPQNQEKDYGSQKSFGGQAVPIAEAKTEMRAALKTCDILPFVSLQRLTQWIRDNSEDRAFAPITLLVGLARDDASDADISNLTSIYMIFNNAIRDEERKTHPERQSSSGDDTKPRFIQNIFEPYQWHPVYFRGVEQMKRGNYKKALTLFNKAFTHLLDQQTTTREVYRQFANKGVCMIAMGDIGGRYFLELARKLDPRYDFARDSLARHDRELAKLEKHKQKDTAAASMLAPLFVRMALRSKHGGKMLNLENDPAYCYYVWLKRFGINFSRHAAPPTRRTELKIKSKARSTRR